MRKAIHRPSGETLYVVRRGRINTRVNRVEDRNGSWLVRTSALKFEGDGEFGGPGRVIPLTALRRLYRHERRSGSREERFNRLTRLGSQCGMSACEFLAHAFDLSRIYFERYNNVEVFVDRVDDDDDDVDIDVPAEAIHFAMLLVQHLAANRFHLPPNAADLAFEFVEHEVSPIRTTRSCYDDGRPASRSGTGGMDALLCLSNGRRPIVAEIKAKTETVGPTFALIQSLMCGVEILTVSQQNRLAQSYPGAFANLERALPEPVDLYLMFERQEIESDLYQRDFAFMSQISTCLLQHELVSGRIGRIVAFKCAVDDNQAVLEVAFRTDGP